MNYLMWIGVYYIVSIIIVWIYCFDIMLKWIKKKEQPVIFRILLCLGFTIVCPMLLPVLLGFFGLRVRAGLRKRLLTIQQTSDLLKGQLIIPVAEFNKLVPLKDWEQWEDCIQAFIGSQHLTQMWQLHVKDWQKHVGKLPDSAYERDIMQKNSFSDGTETEPLHKRLYEIDLVENWFVSLSEAEANRLKYIYGIKGKNGWCTCMYEDRKRAYLGEKAIADDLKRLNK